MVFPRILMACALFAVVGGHWAVLQTVAWTGMVIENAQNAPLSKALRDALSGEKPCHLCHLVQEGREQERHQPANLSAEKKIDKFVKLLAASVPQPPSSDFSYPPDLGSRVCVRPLDPPFHVPIAV